MSLSAYSVGKVEFNTMLSARVRLIHIELKAENHKFRNEPGKSPMGMDLVPVYQEEDGENLPESTLKIDPVTDLLAQVQLKSLTASSYPCVMLLSATLLTLVVVAAIYGIWKGIGLPGNPPEAEEENNKTAKEPGDGIALCE